MRYFRVVPYTGWILAFLGKVTPEFCDGFLADPMCRAEGAGELRASFQLPANMSAGVEVARRDLRVAQALAMPPSGISGATSGGSATPAEARRSTSRRRFSRSTATRRSATFGASGW